MTVRRLETVHRLRYFRFCNVLHIWTIRAIPTYRVYRLYKGETLVLAHEVTYELYNTTIIITVNYVALFFFITGARKSNGSQQKGKNESEAPTTSGKYYRFLCMV